MPLQKKKINQYHVLLLEVEFY